jgi:hypothetical protein
MLPLPLAGLALAGRTLLHKYSTGKNPYPAVIKSRTPQKLQPTTRHIIRKNVNRKVYTRKTPVNNPLQTLLQGVSTGLTQITRSFAREDYDTVIPKLLPADAKVITPQYPEKADKYLLSDADGGSRNELVVTCKDQDVIRTIAFKKQNDQWHKVAEVGNSGYDDLKYRSMADLTGQEKKQLLLGFTQKDNSSILHGYHLENGNFKELFFRPYHKMDVVGGENGKAQLALWTKKESGTYDVELLHWNGTQLEPLQKANSYYHDRVLPYYAQRVKQMPQSPVNWYQLADALEKAELREDALTALNVGLGRKMDTALREQYLALKKKITQK